MKQASNPVPDIPKPPPPPPTPQKAESAAAAHWRRNAELLEASLSDLLLWSERADELVRREYGDNEIGRDEIDSARNIILQVRKANVKAPTSVVTARGLNVDVGAELTRHRFKPRMRYDFVAGMVPDADGHWVDYDYARELLTRLRAANRKLEEIVDVVSAIAAGDMTPESATELAQRAVTEGGKQQ